MLVRQAARAPDQRLDILRLDPHGGSDNAPFLTSDLARRVVAEHRLHLVNDLACHAVRLPFRVAGRQPSGGGDYNTAHQRGRDLGDARRQFVGIGKWVLRGHLA